jgi:hypothetical protein
MKRIIVLAFLAASLAGSVGVSAASGGASSMPMDNGWGCWYYGWHFDSVCKTCWCLGWYEKPCD